MAIKNANSRSNRKAGGFGGAGTSMGSGGSVGGAGTSMGSGGSFGATGNMGTPGFGAQGSMGGGTSGGWGDLDQNSGGSFGGQIQTVAGTPGNPGVGLPDTNVGEPDPSTMTWEERSGRERSYGAYNMAGLGKNHARYDHNTVGPNPPNYMGGYDGVGDTIGGGGGYDQTYGNYYQTMMEQGGGGYGGGYPGGGGGGYPGGGGDGRYDPTTGQPFVYRNEGGSISVPADRFLDPMRGRTTDAAGNPIQTGDREAYNAKQGRLAQHQEYRELREGGASVRDASISAYGNDAGWRTTQGSRGDRFDQNSDQNSGPNNPPAQRGYQAPDQPFQSTGMYQQSYGPNAQQPGGGNFAGPQGTGGGSFAPQPPPQPQRQSGLPAAHRPGLRPDQQDVYGGRQDAGQGIYGGRQGNMTFGPNNPPPPGMGWGTQPTGQGPGGDIGPVNQPRPGDRRDPPQKKQGMPGPGGKGGGWQGVKPVLKRASAGGGQQRAQVNPFETYNSSQGGGFVGQGMQEHLTQGGTPDEFHQEQPYRSAGGGQTGWGLPGTGIPGIIGGDAGSPTPEWLSQQPQATQDRWRELMPGKYPQGGGPGSQPGPYGSPPWQQGGTEPLRPSGPIGHKGPGSMGEQTPQGEAYRQSMQNQQDAIDAWETQYGGGGGGPQALSMAPGSTPEQMEQANKWWKEMSGEDGRYLPGGGGGDDPIYFEGPGGSGIPGTGGYIPPQQGGQSFEGPGDPGDGSSYRPGGVNHPDSQEFPYLGPPHTVGGPQQNPFENYMEPTWNEPGRNQQNPGHGGGLVAPQQGDHAMSPEREQLLKNNPEEFYRQLGIKLSSGGGQQQPFFGGENHGVTEEQMRNGMAPPPSMPPGATMNPGGGLGPWSQQIPWTSGGTVNGRPGFDTRGYIPGKGMVMS